MARFVRERLLGQELSWYTHLPPALQCMLLTHPSLGRNCKGPKRPYRGIKGPTSHFIKQHALKWVVERLRRLPRGVGGPYHWVVRWCSYLAAVPLQDPDFAAAHVKAPPVHLMLPREHATLLVPDDNGVPEPHVPSVRALRLVIEAV